MRSVISLPVKAMKGFVVFLIIDWGMVKALRPPFLPPSVSSLKLAVITASFKMNLVFMSSGSLENVGEQLNFF